MVDIQTVVRMADIAEGQWGQLTVEQAHRSGVADPALVELEALQLIEPVIEGVVRLRAGGRHPFPSLYAAWLRLDPETPAWERVLPAAGVVSHHSAVRLYRLGDLPGDHPQFTVGTSGTRSGAGHLHHADLNPGSWRWVNGLPVTSPTRTLLDLAGSGPLDITDLRLLANGFVQGGWATLDDLTAEFSLEDRHRWMPVLEGLHNEAPA